MVTDTFLDEATNRLSDTFLDEAIGRDRRSHQMKRQRRNFSNDFKKQIVESIVSGTATQAEMAREYRISPVLINKWKKDYKTGKFFENVDSYDMAKQELRIRELERLLGKVTLENEMLKRARDLDSKEKKIFYP